jgi:RNA-directed DNA polymerase
MGKRPAEDELFVGNMGSIQWEIRSSMQRENSLTMETGLERIAEKARSEPRLRFTSLAHHITRERVWTNLCQIPKRSPPGVDGQTVTEAKERFGEWVDNMLQSVHRQGYRAPDIRRVYIPKPGKQEKRPLGVPCKRLGKFGLTLEPTYQARRIRTVRAASCNQTRQEGPGDHLFSGVYAILHAEPEG